MEKEMLIPDGYSARIEGNKVILEPKESEDERIRKSIIRILQVGGYMPDEEKKKAFSYLERQKEQQPAEWSEEDEKFFKTALWHISYSVSNGKTTDDHCDTTDWLKGVKERLKSLCPQPILQPNTNHTIWHNASEEKPTKLPIIHIWHHGNRVNAVVAHENIGLQAELDDINFQPDDKWAYVEDLLNVQPHWKPSEEQISAIVEALKYLPNNKEEWIILEKLMNDLKKL